MDIERLCAPKKCTEKRTLVDAMESGVADRLPSCGDKDPAYRTIWSKDDDIRVRKMAVRVTNKKWEIIRLCLEVLEEYCSMVNELNVREKQKVNIVWSVEDERNVKALRIRNIRFLSLKRGKVKVGLKENVLEQFCEKKGLYEMKEIWLKNVETELKNTGLKELMLKKKLAKSKKRKFESFKECKEILNHLVKDWKETPGMEEEKMFLALKEKVKKKRMELVLNKKKGNKIICEVAQNVWGKKIF